MNLSDSRSFVRAYIETNMVTVDACGGIDRKMSDLIDAMHVSYDFQLRSYNQTAERGCKIVAINRFVLEAALRIELNELQQQALEGFKVSLSGTEDSSKSLDLCYAWLQTILDRTPSSLEGRVLAHWMQQVKRKLFGLKSRDQMMIVLYSKTQGTGKSTALQSLIKPFGPLSLSTTLINLVDVRFQATLDKKYIGILDEMAGAGRADLAELKRIITADTNDVRLLYSNTVEKIKVNCSWIGSSNERIDTLFFDSTGMRRFFEIEYPENRDRERIERILNFDCTDMWKSIDLDVDYLAPVLNQLVHVQDEMTYSDERALFLGELGKPESGDVAVPCSDVYNFYRIWAENNGFKPVSLAIFGRKFGFGKGVCKRVGGDIVKCYLLSYNPMQKMDGKVLSFAPMEVALSMN